jgi:hypothetical protein
MPLPLPRGNSHHPSVRPEKGSVISAVDNCSQKVEGGWEGWWRVRLRTHLLADYAETTPPPPPPLSHFLHSVELRILGWVEVQGL